MNASKKENRRGESIGTHTTLEDLYQRLAQAKARRSSVIKGEAKLRMRRDGETMRTESREEALNEIESYITFLSYLITLKELQDGKMPAPSA
jgi:hypothetical protein